MDSMISENVKNIELSGIRKFYNKVAKVEGALSLTLGQPDFPVPEKIKQAVINAVEENKTTYTSNEGIPELRSEICNYLKGMDINYTKEEVCITVGGSEGLMDVFATFINPGDKILIPSPAYPAYESCVKLLGGHVINYDLEGDEFLINCDSLIEIIQREKPKLLVLSYPSNPTGCVLGKEIRDKLNNIILENDILVVSDEMYSSLSFEDKYYSIAQCENIRNKIVLVGGFSKMFSMTGLRVGYVCAAKGFIESIVKVHQYNVSCAPSIVQWGAYAGLKEALVDVEHMRQEFINRRDFLYNELKALGFEVTLPQGAFYMFPSIKKFNMKSEEFCDSLLYNGKVAIVPGSAFGSGGEGYVRISYASSKKELAKAVERIKLWMNTYCNL
ncbi:MAG: aminotransferase class I/II-fold pyridoxal phosphate-dependent enzyme [Bacillota bacterium]|nr:aminotransferase class I/II-fold pyridoxal phosphate-dependent enzyme [Bacillota bacterium]